MTEKLLRRYVTITHGMRGFFAVLVGVYQEPGKSEFLEPIQTGIGSYRSREKAIPEAKGWAEAEEIPFVE